MVLSRYGLLTELKKSGSNLVGCCPIHKGTNPRQFSVDPERNIFNCFGNCKSGGNVLDFVAKMENIPVRNAALKLKEWFPEAGTAEQDARVLKEAPENGKKLPETKDEPGRRIEPEKARKARCGKRKNRQRKSRRLSGQKRRSRRSR